MMQAENIIKVPSLKRVSDPSALKDIRAKIVNELVETERKFVQDMEALQVEHYLLDFRSQKVLVADVYPLYC